jgi:autotransporter-associated beta strand protein
MLKFTNRPGRVRRCCASPRSIALFAAAAAASLAPSRQAHAVTFNFAPAATTPQQAIDGFAAAGQRWASLFSDDVTVNISIDFAPIASGALGSTGSSLTNYPYTNTRAAFVADATTNDDITATSFLQPGPATRTLINYTSNNPHGAGSPTPYLDANGGGNNTNVRIHHANAKALGLRSPTNDATDASISFNSNFSWDFNPYDGVTAGAYDFIGIATHEIGHALGFSSGVDLLDTNSPSGTGTFLAEDDVQTKAMDLFRYSTESKAQGVGVFDMSADARSKYFSINGGTTNLATFSTGRVHGDGQQAGHWKDNLNLGIMDPTIGSGTQQFISALDRRMLDVVGWNPSNKWLWMDPAGGLFNSAIRWSSTVVPQAAQEATWNLNSTYTISFTTPQTTANANVRGGNVTFNLGSTTYTAGAAINIAPNAGEIATLNITAGTLSAMTVNIGGSSAAAGGTGVLAVNSGATLNAPTAIHVWPGGTLRYNGGAITSPQIQLSGGILHAVTGVASAVPITTSGGTIQIDAGVHTLAGSLTTTGGTLNKTGAGTLIIAGPQTHTAGAILQTSAGTTALDTNAGSIAAPGTLELIANATTNFNATQNLKSLNIGGGAAVALAAGGARSIKTVTIGLDIASGAKLDLADNRLIVDYPAASPVQSIHSLLAAGRNDGTWDGPGINTSLAGDAGLFALGYGEASDLMGLAESETAMWGSQIVDATTILVRYTYDGDANLDGTIDGGDYGVIDNFIQVPDATGYWEGDFNYDGVVDGGDYGVIDNNIQAQAAPLAQSGSIGLSAVTAVPEPSAYGFAIAAVAVARTRRRRRTDRANS